MNEQRIAELADFIEKLPPGKFYMGDFLRDGRGTSHDTSYALRKQNTILHECGTKGCIALWAVILFGNPEKNHRYLIDDEAMDLLGLSRGEAEDLFYGKWSAVDMPDITREEVVAKLRSLVGSGLRSQ